MLLSLLIALLVMAIILYVVNLVIGMMGLPQNVKIIAMLIVGLIFLFYLLNILGVPLPAAVR